MNSVIFLLHSCVSYLHAARRGNQGAEQTHWVCVGLDAIPVFQ